MTLILDGGSTRRWRLWAAGEDWAVAARPASVLHGHAGRPYDGAGEQSEARGGSMSEVVATLKMMARAEGIGHSHIHPAQSQLAEVGAR